MGDSHASRSQYPPHYHHSSSTGGDTDHSAALAKVNATQTRLQRILGDVMAKVGDVHNEQLQTDQQCYSMLSSISTSLSSSLASVSASLSASSRMRAYQYNTLMKEVDSIRELVALEFQSLRRSLLDQHVD